VISDRFGNLLQQMSFDAFGARRNPATTASPWVTLPILGQQNFDTSHTTHGYTGHEGADKVGLIHMNGRMYDPVLGRFIQADSIVQDPYDPQSLNRYAYVLNNPLTATDPSGNISFKNALKLVAVVAITVFTGGAAAGSFAFIGTLTAAQGFAVVVAGGALSGAIMGGAKGALRGAFTAAVFFGVGQGANALQGAKGTLSHAAFANNGLGRAALHGVAGGALASLQGGNFGHAFLTAGIGKAITSNVPESGSDYADGALGALVGGTISEATGEGFSNGALTGAMQFAFNQLVATAEENRAIFRTRIDARLSKYLKLAMQQNSQGLTVSMITGTQDVSVAVDTKGKGVATLGGKKFSFDAGKEDFGDLVKFDQRIAKMGLINISASVAQSGMIGLTASFSPPGFVNQLLGRLGGGLSFTFEVNPVNSVVYNSGALGRAAQSLLPTASSLSD